MLSPMVIIIILSTEGLRSQRMKATSMNAPTHMVIKTPEATAMGRGMKALIV